VKVLLMGALNLDEYAPDSTLFVREAGRAPGKAFECRFREREIARERAGVLQNGW
jgi:hypothetical protein